MPLSAGDRLGPYEILALIGAGGMGEVYRARDIKLNREVAIKVLPESLAHDPGRMARFEREARVLASLNHPNIAAIYGVEEHALVMEFVNGDSPKGPMPVEDVWKIGLQIADALEYAHEKGVVHRDLKPANLKVTPEGVVKLLDFGLAKAFSETPEGAARDRSDSPTVTLGATSAGTIMGTPAYMSPEQARGKKVDKRADIWAFGVVLFEMLSGKQLFQGETVSDTLAAVLIREPDWQAVPDKVRRLLRRCLEKDPNQRLRDIGDASALVEEAPRPAGAPAPRLPWLAWGWVAAGLVAALALSFAHWRDKPPEVPILRTTILPPEKTSFDFAASYGTVAISPDGRRLVFAATSADGKRQLWVRPLDAVTAQPLLGTDGATFPFWSPDSRFVAFFAAAKLKKIDTAGGPAITLADAPNARGGSWSRDGVIVFAPVNIGSLLRVSAAGGAATAATVREGAEATRSHRWPWFLPDGKHFVYATLGQLGDPMVLQIGAVDSKERKRIGEADSNAVYSSGYLLFLRENTLMAQPFDARRLAVTAEAVPVAEQVQHVILNGRMGVFSASDQGLLIFQTGAALEQRLTWFDRSGKSESTLGDAADFAEINFSPDRKSLAASVIDPLAGNVDIWMYDVSRGFPSRFTVGTTTGTVGNSAIWSPDGRTIVFRSNRKGPGDLYRKAADGSGGEELLYADNLVKQATSWSPDGKFLLFGSFDPRNPATHIWVLPMPPPQSGGAPKPFPFLRTSFSQANGQFSSDGRWIAYQSNESGRFEIYAAPFPGPGGKRQISTSGGVLPRWRHEGKEIFYVAPDLRLMAAPVNIHEGALDVGAARPLFGPISTTVGYAYDVSLDGQHILAVSAPERKAGQPLTLVQNWTAGLKK